MPIEEQETYIDLGEAAYNIIQDLLRRWMLILWVGLMTALGADLVLSLMYVPMYSTEATYVMRTIEYTDDEEMTEIAEAFDYILQSNVFLNLVKKDLGVEELHGEFSSAILPGTKMIKIKAVADGPRLSYMMMHSMTEHYMEVSEKVIGDAQLMVVEQINVPKTPYNGNSHLKNLAFFGAVGMGVMILILGFLSFVKDTVKEKRDITEKLHIRNLGSVCRESKIYFRQGRFRTKKSILITQLSTSFWYIEEFKKIRSRIEKSGRKHGYQVFMVTSSAENEGKSSVVVNLALALAENGDRVLVADMDFRKPAVYKVMDLKQNNGIQEVMEGKKSWKEAVVHDKRRKLDYLLKAGYAEDVSRLLGSEVLLQMLQEMKEEYDYILLDSAPVSYMSDAVVLSKAADAVLLVVRQNFMPVTLINRAVNKLMVTKTPVIGAVLNQSRRSTARLTGDSYTRYYYREGERNAGR